MNKKKATFFLIVLLISAMGPYVFPSKGIRTEHFILYGLGFYFLIRYGITFISGVKPTFVYILIGLFFLLISIFVTRTLSSDFSPKIYKVFADLDNFVQPILLILITNFCLQKLPLQSVVEVLSSIFKTVVILLSLNAMLAISSVFFGTWYTPYFNNVGNVEEGMITTFALASSGGRFTGIFSQPFESGLAYGVTLILVVLFFFLKRELGNVLPVSNMFILLSSFFMLMGGILSVSKIFFPLAFLIALLLFVILFRKKMLVFLKSIILISVLVILASIFFLSQWSGSDYFLRLIFIDSGSDILALYTAERFAGNDYTGNSFILEQLSDPNLLLGYGLGSIQTPDNAYLEILYFGGIFGLFGYLLIYFVFFYFAIKMKKANVNISLYLLAVITLTLFAGLGAPIFGINRSNFFLLIPLIAVFTMCLKIVKMK